MSRESEEFVNGLEKYVSEYIEDEAKIALNKLESVMIGEGCLCRNCVTQAVNDMNSFIKFISPEDTFSECGEELFFTLDEHFNITKPRWYLGLKGDQDEGTTDN